MRERTARVGAAGLCAALTVGLLWAAAGPAEATVSPYRPVVTKVKLASPTGLAATASRLYVTDGNSVKVYKASTRALVTTVTGVFGASSPIVVPGRGEVLVAAADGSEVVAIDTATNAVTRSGATASCPRSLQVTGNTVWYVGDCAAPYHVYSLPLDTLTGPATAVPDVSTSSAGPAPLRVHGSTLALGQYDTVDVYSIAADDTLSLDRSITVYSGEAAFELSDDSLYIASIDGYEYRRYDLATGNLTGTYGTGSYPEALAVSPDGGTLGAGLSSAFYDDGLFVFDVDAGTAVVQGPVDVGESNFANVRAVTFSPDGSLLYALADYFTGQASVGTLHYLVASTTSPPTRLAATLDVQSPAAFGKPLRLSSKVTCAGKPAVGVTVRFTLTIAGETQQVSATTSKTGVARTSVGVKYSGSVQATAIGGPTTILTTTKAHRFVVPAGMTVTMSKAAAVRGGIRYYDSPRAVKSWARLRPSHPTATVHVFLEHKTGGAWRVVDRITLTANTRSVVGVQLISARKGWMLRIRFRYPANQYNGGVQKVTPSFVVR